MTFSTLGTDTTTHQPVYLYKSSRTQGLYIVGATGTGKSGLLENLINDDTKQGTGVIVIDPHGDLIKKVIARLRNKDELDRVILIDPLDIDYSPGINIYQCDNPLDDTQVEQAKERVLHIFTLSARERGDESLGVRVSQGILNSAYTLIDSSPVYGGTMLELPILFTEDIPRRNMVKQVEGKDDAVVDYWKFYETYDKDGKRDRADMVVNKIQEYQMNRFMRRIIGQSKSTINFRDVIDSNPGKIVLVKLRRDHPELAKLIGSLVIAQILGAALSREREGSERRQVHIYADEFQLYATEDFTYLLTECRKYGMAVTVAHQSRDFIDLKNKAATLQAVNLITFRVIRKDADEVAGNYDTTPPLAETRREEKTMPVRNLIERVISDKKDVIFSDKCHPNDSVNKFIYDWVGVRIKHFSYLHHVECQGQWCTFFHLRELDTLRVGLNKLFYEVMRTGNPHTILSIALLELMVRPVHCNFYDRKTYASWAFERMGEKTNYYYQSNFSKNNRRNEKEVFTVDPPAYKRTEHPVILPEWKHAPRDFVWCLFKEGIYGEEAVTDQVKEAYRLLWEAKNETELSHAFSRYEQIIRETLREQMQKEFNRYLGHEQHGWIYGAVESKDYYELFDKFCDCGLLWLIPKDKLDREEKRKKNSASLFPMIGIYSNYQHSDDEWGYEWHVIMELFKGSGKESIVQSRLQAEIDELIAYQQPHFQAFVRELREVLQVLAAEPIEERSGIFEEKPGIQFSSDEMRNRIANELATQQNRIAKVRVLDKDNHIVEHTIKTRDIEQGVYDKTLDQRFAYIRNRMIMIDPVHGLHGYWRAKAEIEQEIAQRQAKLRQAAQPQKTVQEPLELPKRERRIPLQPAASESQLEQELIEMWQKAKDKGLTTLEFKEWCKQEAQQIEWLKKLKGI